MSHPRSNAEVFPVTLVHCDIPHDTFRRNMKRYKIKMHNMGLDVNSRLALSNEGINPYIVPQQNLKKNA